MGTVQLGLDQALSEITLVLFTTLAPAGAFACVCLSVFLQRRMNDRAVYEAVAHLMALPILVTLVGLIASATHLGSPSNALYVLAGVGRSPLSNEVVSGAVFLGFAGTFWFYSFSERRIHIIERLWLFCIALSALVFIGLIARAYEVNTIITWTPPSAQIALGASSVMLGSMVLWFTFLCVNIFFASVPLTFNKRTNRLLDAITAAATVVWMVSFVLYMMAISHTRNEVLDITVLIPSFGVWLLLALGLVACGVVLYLIVRLRCEKESLLTKCFWGGLSMLICASGVFVGRFLFYMAHMTVGISY